MAKTRGLRGSIARRSDCFIWLNGRVTRHFCVARYLSAAEYVLALDDESFHPGIRLSQNLYAAKESRATSISQTSAARRPKLPVNRIRQFWQQ